LAITMEAIMGVINLARSALKSEQVRTAIAGASRTRQITRSQPDQGNWFTNILGSIWGGITGLTGFIIGALGAIGFSFVTLYNWLRSGISFIYNFNWNITDQQIDQQLKQMRLMLVGQMGETAGNFIGFLACGVIPGLIIAKFNKPLGAYVLKEVSEEAFDELMGNLRVLLSQTTRTIAAHIMYGAYKNIRRTIKEVFRNPNSQQSQAAQAIFGSNFNNWIRAWGAPSSKPWSFAIAVEEAIESLPDGYIEEFVENFYEGFLEGCDEAGFVVAQSLDSWYAEQRLAKNQLLGDDTVLEVTPNREAEKERVLVAGPMELVKTQLVNIVTQHQLIDNRDIGQFVGEIHRESMTKNFIEGIAIKINFRGEKEPPFRTSKRVNYTIPMIKRSKLDWEVIKLACGGTNGYLWGRFLATVRFKQTGVPNLKIYGATSGEVEDRAKAFIDLTDLEIATLTIAEEKKEGRRREFDKALYKETTRVYPAFLTIVNREKVLLEEQGRATLSGVYKERRFRIPLWTNDAPPDFDDIKTQILSTRGANP
jgi:hypothetical protein